ncbi:MAG: CBU_0592 family membrane protein [Burkholderiales bacterium]
MMHQTEATVIGFAGVALLLLAFLFNLFKLLRSDGYSYATLNCVGAALACYSSYLISFMPFVLLEGVWALVAAGAIAQKAIAGSGPSDPLAR